jgi:hypothetical protein
MSRRIQSLGESKNKRLILRGLDNCISHCEATHLSGSSRDSATFLITASVLGIGMDCVGWTGAVK